LERVKGFLENFNENSVYRKRWDFSTKETLASEKKTLRFTE
jgi:hypothetical protein